MAVLEVKIKEVKKSKEYSDEEFMTNLANGYLNVEIAEKEELMKK